MVKFQSDWINESRLSHSLSSRNLQVNSLKITDKYGAFFLIENAIETYKKWMNNIRNASVHRTKPK